MKSLLFFATLLVVGCTSVQPEPAVVPVKQLSINPYLTTPCPDYEVKLHTGNEEELIVWVGGLANLYSECQAKHQGLVNTLTEKK